MVVQLHQGTVERGTLGQAITLLGLGRALLTSILLWGGRGCFGTLEVLCASCLLRAAQPLVARQI